jgi:hypothetical protein
MFDSLDEVIEMVPICSLAWSPFSGSCSPGAHIPKGQTFRGTKSFPSLEIVTTIHKYGKTCTPKFFLMTYIK